MPLTKDELIAGLEALLVEAKRPDEPPKPTRILVPSGGDIQAVLNGTDVPIIELESGGRYASVVIARPVRLECHGATLHGEGVPAIYVPPGEGSHDIDIIEPVVSSTFQVPIRLGDNGPSQARLADVPRRIRIVAPVILDHNHAEAKNGIENNAAEVEISDVTIRNLYSPGRVESHGIVTINTPGGLKVMGGTVSGASTPLFTGGDPIDLPDTDIADVWYDDLDITRPAEWQGVIDGNFKNLVEFKNVTRGRVTRCRIYNNWGPIQKGFACMLTPKVDGRVVDVEFDDNDIYSVGGGFNVLGRNPTGQDPTRTDNIRITNNRVIIDKNAYGPGSFGWFLLLSAGPGRVLVEGNNVKHNANAFIYVDDRERIASLIVRNNTFNAGTYGIRTPAGNNGDNWREVFDELVVTGNTISGASAVFKRNFPENTYV